MSYRVGKKYIYKKIFKETIIIILEISIYTLLVLISSTSKISDG